MSADPIPDQPSFVPEACTLPTREQPLRVAEFDELFGTAARRVERPGPATLSIELVHDDRVAAQAASLAVRETACCSFFTFTLTATDGRLLLEVRLPDAHIGVLDALADRVAARAHQ